MKVIILGAGQVGYNIARYLASEENDITVVDQSTDLLRKIGDKIDIQPVVGFASHPDILQQAGAANADLLIAVTGSDEVNIVACQIAHSLFNVDMKIARIRHQSYLNPIWSDLFHSKHLAIDVVISPEIEVARAISRSTQIVGAFDVISLIGDKVKAIGVRCAEKSPIINTPLRLLPGLFPKLNLAVICISREDTVFIPSGDDKLLVNDEVYFIAEQKDINAAMEAFDFYDQGNRRILIVGSGSIGQALASEIENTQPEVNIKIIEKDHARAESAARHLKRAEVLCGDALDYEILAEANVQNSETVVCVTDDDKVNILAALLAKRHGGGRALSLLNNMSYSSLVTSLGVDAVISPRSITVSKILQHVRQGKVRSVHSLGDGYAEIIEAETQETSHIIGLSISDITIKGSIMVAALIRGNDFILCPSKTIIRTGDRLVVIAAKESVKKVEKLFSVRPSYL